MGTVKVSELIGELIEEIQSDIQPTTVNGSELVEFMMEGVFKAAILTLPLSKNAEEQDALTDACLITGISILIEAGLYSVEKGIRVANALFDATKITKRPMKNVTTGIPDIDMILSSLVEEA